MKTNQTTLQSQRQRKLLMILPLIVFPFLTLLFWTLGGGKIEASAATTKGLSMQLPGIMLKSDSSGDKLSFYEKAKADSDRQQQLRKSDPFSKAKPDTTPPGGFSGGLFSPRQPFGEYDAAPGDPATNAGKINQRLTALQAVLNKPPAVPAKEKTAMVETPVLPDSLLHPKQAEDPELRQMNSMLEKILDIQHPERLLQKLAATTDKPAIRKFRAIPAMIDGTQKIVQGTVVCLKLLDTVTISGQLFQKGQKLYGSGTLASQRYTLNVKSIHVGASFYPVDLTVLDATDGMDGISVPEAITTDAVRNGAVNGVQGLDMMSFDPSVTAQLTTAGINTVKNAFGRKAKQVKGKIKDGHLLLLRDNTEIRNQH